MKKDGNPSTKSTRYVDENVNTLKETKTVKRVSCNEVEDMMLKGHPIPQIS
jgi:hypothetical protein